MEWVVYTVYVYTVYVYTVYAEAKLLFQSTCSYFFQLSNSTFHSIERHFYSLFKENDKLIFKKNIFCFEEAVNI